MRKMRNTSIFVYIFFLMGALLFSGLSAAHAGQSYTLVCKGGGSMELEYDAPHLYKTSGHSLIISKFRRARYAASERQPEAGECAWIDRPMKEDEAEGERNQIIYFGGGDDRFNYLIFSSSGVARWGIGKPGKGANYLIDAVTSGKIFYVRCHKDRNSTFANFLRIDSVGP